MRFSFCREVNTIETQAFGVGFAILLMYFLGLDGLLYSFPVSDILTFIIALFIIVKTYKELNGKSTKKPKKHAEISE